MAEICIKIPEEWKNELEGFGIETSLVIKALVKKELEERRRLRSIISRSKLTEKDVKELSDEVDNALTKRFRES